MCNVLYFLELDKSIGDIHSDMVDIEVEIILDIQVRLAECEDQLSLYADHCYELDWYAKVIMSDGPI